MFLLVTSSKRLIIPYIIICVISHYPCSYWTAAADSS
uniref:Uncharacterized protein n=1 Tax=Anguilla anguilla TaxID=7936 RepID=A0A0E9T333_ANGAN